MAGQQYKGHAPAAALRFLESEKLSYLKYIVLILDSHPGEVRFSISTSSGCSKYRGDGK